VKLTLAGVLYLIAAVIFGIGFFLGWAPEPYGAWGGRIQSLAFCFVAVALLLTHTG
jgi:hypothetical protein